MMDPASNPLIIPGSEHAPRWVWQILRGFSLVEGALVLGVVWHNLRLRLLGQPVPRVVILSAWAAAFFTSGLCARMIVYFDALPRWDTLCVSIPGFTLVLLTQRERLKMMRGEKK